MDQPLYDIYFTGKLVEGADPESAKASFAKMFKASPDAVAKFFSGKAHILKRGVDKAESLKYKAALHKAGMLVAFKAHQSEPPAADVHQAASPAAPAPSTQQPATAAANSQPQETAGDQGSWSLAPVGSDVLKADERQQTPAKEIDTSAIKMVSAFASLDPEPKEVPPPPNTSHISVAQAGEDLLVDKPEDPPPLPLDLDAITLAPPGTELEELHEDLPPVNPDISGISIAEPGADLLEGQPKTEPPPAPNTDHLKVSDQP